MRIASDFPRVSISSQMSKRPTRKASPQKSDGLAAGSTARHGDAISPTGEEILARVASLQLRKPEYVQSRTILRTAQGRPIDAVTFTDHRVDDADKQHVLIVAGQHGNEESARMVALRLMDYLLSSDGRPLLRRQKIVIVPNASPDAAAADTYETPAGVKPNLDHADTGAVSPEAIAFEMIANELQPDVYVDMHARGHAGCSHDIVLFPPSKPYTEDERLLYEIAGAMADAGERSGIPHAVHPLSWPGWGGTDLNQPSSTLYAYRRFKSLVFLTESAEHNEIAYPANRRALAGVNRLKPLLAVGTRRYPRMYYPGYPCSIAVGMMHTGIVAAGKTAAARRASRIELWQHAASFTKLTPVLPEPPQAKTIQLAYTGPKLTAGAGIQVRVAGRWHAKTVTINGQRLSPGETDGFYSWQGKFTTFAVATVPELTAGEYEIAFAFQ